ncbi:MAG: carbohydrate porin [Nitrospirota bacterium]|nr:MAG: carbohydrate porin [Nitrospirota bacterium]
MMKRFFVVIVAVLFFMAVPLYSYSAELEMGALEVGGGITMVIQSTSGNDGNIAGEDVTDGSISADLELSSSVGQKGTAFLHLEVGSGEGLQDDEITSFWGVNDDAGDTQSFTEVSEAWYEHKMSDRTVLTVGKIDLSAYFDTNEVANDETEQFLATGFVGNVAIEFPDNALGARLTHSVSDAVDLSVAWQAANADHEDIINDSFFIIEGDIKVGVAGKEGNYRVYFWYNSADHPTLTDPAAEESGWGIGTSIDQPVTDAITVFARLGVQDADIYPFDMAWSLGAGINGRAWGRNDDVIGAAFGMAMLSDDYENTLANPGDESHFEAYYRYAINENIAVTPDLQVVMNAEGDSDFDTVIVAGVRGQFSF